MYFVLYPQVLVSSRCRSGHVAAALFAGITTTLIADVECLRTAVAVATLIISRAPSSVVVPARTRMMTTSP